MLSRSEEAQTRSSWQPGIMSPTPPARFTPPIHRGRARHVILLLMLRRLGRVMQPQITFICKAHLETIEVDHISKNKGNIIKTSTQKLKEKNIYIYYSAHNGQFLACLSQHNSGSTR